MNSKEKPDNSTIEDRSIADIEEMREWLSELAFIIPTHPALHHHRINKMRVFLKHFVFNEERRSLIFGDLLNALEGILPLSSYLGKLDREIYWKEEIEKARAAVVKANEHLKSIGKSKGI